jgi:adenosine deaminase
MMTTPSPQSSWYERLPKVELHLHLEGAIPLPALWTLVQKYGSEPGLESLDDLRARFVFRDFPHFLTIWSWKNRYLREYEDFTFIAEAVARDLAEQNIRYVEAYFSPSDFAFSKMQPARIATAIRAGLERAPGTRVALIVDVVRNMGPQAGAITLAQVCEVKQEAGIIGLGIGGAEHNFPPEPFAELYCHARALGLHTTAHAGEAAGAASIWGALRSLEVERLGHATRAGEDAELLDYLGQCGIPLEMCPLSNVRTGVVPDLESHPIRRFYDLGLRVTVNSDDPKMFHNSLAEEYRLLVERLGFTRQDVRSLILNGIQATWLTEEQKQALRQEFMADPAWVE